MIPLSNQIRCIECELARRRVVYTQWRRKGRVSPAIADEEIETMEAVLATLRELERVSTTSEINYHGAARSHF